LEAFVILCGGTNDPAASNDGLDGIMNANASKKSSSTALDKYTMQEKIVPLIRAIKTKEPAVAIAALNVLRQVGGVADADFVAMDILPVLWSMSLGPLLNLKQFQSFMELIKSLSSRVEAEQTKKLQELSGTNGNASQNDDFMSFGGTNAFGTTNGGTDGGEIDFEQLVKGKAGTSDAINPMDAGWDAAPPSATSQSSRNSQPKPAAFSWSTPSPTTQSFHQSNNSMSAALKPQQPGPASRTITPDLSRIEALSPTTTQYSQPLQPQSSFSAPLQPQPSTHNAPMSSFQSPPAPTSTINWGAAVAPASSPWASSSASSQSLSSLGNSMSSLSMNQQQQQRPAMNQSSSFSLPPPPGAGSFSIQPPPQQQKSRFPAPPMANAWGGQQQTNAFGVPPQQQNNAFGGMGMGNATANGQQQQKKSGLDAWESLL
jgi:SCY1-like protein 2